MEISRTEQKKRKTGHDLILFSIVQKSLAVLELGNGL
jgi:hypothetical protein